MSTIVPDIAASYVIPLQWVKRITVREAPFSEMRWFYMDIAQLALYPSPSVKRVNVGKKCSKPSWQALAPPTLSGNAHMETHFNKGLLLCTLYISK